EDDDDLIVRCYETAGVAGAATLRLSAWNRVIETTFSPYEIKTFRVPRDGGQPVAETDLIEWHVDASAASFPGLPGAGDLRLSGTKSFPIRRESRTRRAA